ncbi:MAG: metal ABC transporter permease [Spirochaetes bacterium]|nr:metal ABC transporter permease [Spirochaetota bacterium]
MFDFFEYSLFVNSLLAAILASISCGIIGTYIVSRRIVFISGGISHASFGGIGIGYYLGINPLLGAAVFAVLSALGIENISKKTNINRDSAIGILWSLGMAIGLIFIYITPGYVPNLMSYLFGNILTVSLIDIYMMLGLSIIIVLFFIFNFRKILFISFDEEFSKTRRMPVTFINHILLSLVALTIVINIRVVGIILVISLLTIPQAIAKLFSNNFKTIMFYSIFFSLLSSISGLIISYNFNIPSGAAIIFASVLYFIILWALKTIVIKKRILRKLNMEKTGN